MKKAAKKTQLNKKKLDLQTGQRVLERLIIQRAYDLVTAETAAPQETPITSKLLSQASKGTYKFICDNTTGTNHVSACLTWKRQKHAGLVPLHHDHIIRTLITTLFETYAITDITLGGPTVLEIPFFTEYERNGFIYRAHPDYRGEGAYYDWAQINWYVGDDPATGEPMHKPYIGRLLAFIEHPDGDTYVIVHSVLARNTGHVEHGVFGHFWHLEVQGTETAHQPVLQLVHVDCLLEHVCMIPYTSTDPFMWVHLWHPSEWPGCFQTIAL